VSETKGPSDEDAQRLLADLDRAGRIQRAVLAEAAAAPSHAAEARLSASAPRSGPTAGRRHVRRVLAALASAALLALAWLAWRAGEGRAPRSPDEILGVSVTLIEPRGETASFAVFDWEGAERASWYVVVVLDADTDAEIDRSPELEDTRWQVPEERWTAWPRVIRWEVRPFDAAGRPGRAASAGASLSR
jgi:hypothetical protein